MKRLEYIDGLRAVAALMVLLTHMWVYMGAPALSFHAGGRTVALAVIPAVGNVGVNLFLVLSGFCLAWPFACNPGLRERTTIWGFWKRRFCRIAPAYYVSIVVVFAVLMGVVFMQGSGMVPSAWEIVPHVLFVHNLSAEHVSTINSSYWSLALEFQLYLLFPLFLEAIHRWRFLPVVLVVLLVQCAYRLWLEHELPMEVMGTFGFVLPKAVFGRMLDFVLGMVTAHGVAGALESVERPWLQRVSGVGTVVVLGGAFALFCSGVGSDAIRDVAWAVGFSLLILWGSVHRGVANRVLSTGVLVRVGVMSYSLYLLHEPLLAVAGEFLRPRVKPGWAFVLGFGLMAGIVGIAWMFYQLVEKRALDYFAKGRQREKRKMEAALTSDLPAMGMELAGVSNGGKD
jgi:peptidoglycan/LPS O-acetylase OafA/YrhL